MGIDVEPNECTMCEQTRAPGGQSVLLHLCQTHTARGFVLSFEYEPMHAIHVKLHHPTRWQALFGKKATHQTTRTVHKWGIVGSKAIRVPGFIGGLTNE